MRAAAAVREELLELELVWDDVRKVGDGRRKVKGETRDGAANARTFSNYVRTSAPWTVRQRS